MARQKKKTTLVAGEPAPKAESSDASVRSYTTHKARSAWFQARESWPLREAPVEQLAWSGPGPPYRAGGHRWATWEPVGPANIGGRMTCAVCHPPSRRSCGPVRPAAGSGTRPTQGRAGGRSGTTKPSLNIGALALDPQDPEPSTAARVRPTCRRTPIQASGCTAPSTLGGAGSCSAPPTPPGCRGGSARWRSTPSTPPPAGGGGGPPRRRRDRLVRLHRWRPHAGPGCRSIGISLLSCHDVRFHPSRPGTIYVTISALGMKNGIWRSTDEGATGSSSPRDCPLAGPDRSHRRWPWHPPIPTSCTRR